MAGLSSFRFGPREQDASATLDTPVADCTAPNVRTRVSSTITTTNQVNRDELPFEESVYRAWNPDVDAAIRAGTLVSGRVHYEVFGRKERRAPFLAASERRAALPLRAGDELVQQVRPSADWWAGAAFWVRTFGGLARLELECEVKHVQTDAVLRTWRVEEWATDGEELVLKFPPIPDSAQQAYRLRLRVRQVAAEHTVQMICEPLTDDGGVRWNGGVEAAVRCTFELRCTPPTLPGPSGITLNPITQCAGRCIHCLSWAQRGKPGRLRDEWIEALRTHFRDGPGVAWCVDYATDFFHAAKNRPELIDLVAANGNTAVNTEGQHVTEEQLRRLLRGQVRSIGFSCDAATEATYARVRKGLGKLNTVLTSAQMALRVRREMGLEASGKPWIALSFVVMQANVREAVAFVELAAKTGVDAVWFNQLWVCSSAMVPQSLMFDAARWREQLECARVRGRELGIGVFNDVDLRPEQPQRGVKWCPEPWRSMVVLGNGDVLACASPASRIGSLGESTIEEIWNGAAFQTLRSRVNSDRPPLMCEHCPVYRKPGNADGVFLHHLIPDYELRRDLVDDEGSYAAAFRRRFSFREAAEARETKVQ